MRAMPLFLHDYGHPGFFLQAYGGIRQEDQQPRQYTGSMDRRLIDGLAALPMVEAIALSGSRTNAISDSDSDYDIYVYSSCRVPPEARKELLSGLFHDAAVDCSPFEEGDEAEDDAGDVYDIMYRSTGWTEREVQDVWRDCNARLGYTTSILCNIRTSHILYDRTGWLGSLQEELKGPYPDKLRRNIVGRNLSIIDGMGKSTFLIQAERAAKRGDAVSSCHRRAAILASLFDIVFALSRELHPGEKKLLSYASLLCRQLPEDFGQLVRKAIATVGKDGHIDALKRLIACVEQMAEECLDA